MNIDNAKAQLRKGVLELAILSIIEQEGEAYPTDILARLKEANLIVVEGTLYPLLSRLKRGGLLDYSWRESSAGPPRKYYRLTSSGKDFRNDLLQGWRQLVLAIDQTIKTPVHE